MVSFFFLHFVECIRDPFLLHHPKGRQGQTPDPEPPAEHGDPAVLPEDQEQLQGQGQQSSVFRPRHQLLPDVTGGQRGAAF